MKPPSPLRAFTLIEMMITMAVFVLLSAAIFGIVTGVLESAASLQDNQNRADQTMALQAFLKTRLEGLPVQGALVSYRRGDGEGLGQNGIIFGTAGFLTAIDAKVQANGLYLLRLATFRPSEQNVDALTTFEQEVTGDDSSLAWTSLIRDVRRMDWKFQALNATQWVDLWTQPGNKPNLVEISLQISGELQSSIMDFWLPPVMPPPGLKLQAANAATTNVTNNVTPAAHAP